MKTVDPQRASKAQRVARQMLEAIDRENRRYQDIDARGGDAFEYGKRTREQVIADELLKRKLI